MSRERARIVRTLLFAGSIADRFRIGRQIVDPMKLQRRVNGPARRGQDNRLLMNSIFEFTSIC